MRSVARGGGFVIGRDVPARPIARLLKNLLIHEPLPDGTDTRVRLAGTAVKHRFGAEVHGTMFSDLFPPAEFRHHLAGALDVVRTGVPVVVDSSLKRGALVELHTEIVISRSGPRRHDAAAARRLLLFQIATSRLAPARRAR